MKESEAAAVAWPMWVFATCTLLAMFAGFCAALDGDAITRAFMVSFAIFTGLLAVFAVGIVVVISLRYRD